MNAKTETVIQATSAAPSSEAGGDQTIQPESAIGIADAAIQGRRRPQACSVRSLQRPVIGSVIASHSRLAPKIRPIAAGAISRTSIAYLLT